MERSLGATGSACGSSGGAPVAKAIPRTERSRSVPIKRRIINGVPAANTVWVSSAEAYAEVQFDDDDPTMNEALLAALKKHRATIESDFGGHLAWRGPAPGASDEADEGRHAEGVRR